MIEKNYLFRLTEESVVEKIVNDNDAVINHVFFKKGEGLPEHNSNSNVYLIIVKGTMSIKLADQDQKEYEAGNIVNIPYGIRMKIGNEYDSMLEFFIVKAPNPANYGGK